MEFILEMLGSFNIQKSINIIHHINWHNKENMIISTDRGKNISQNSTSIEGNFLSLIKGIDKKPKANIMFNGERLNTLPLRLGTR